MVWIIMERDGGGLDDRGGLEVVEEGLRYVGVWGGG